MRRRGLRRRETRRRRGASTRCAPVSILLLLLFVVVVFFPSRDGVVRRFDPMVWSQSDQRHARRGECDRGRDDRGGDGDGEEESLIRRPRRWRSGERGGEDGGGGARDGTGETRRRRARRRRRRRRCRPRRVRRARRVAGGGGRYAPRAIDANVVALATNIAAPTFGPGASNVANRENPGIANHVTPEASSFAGDPAFSTRACSA